MGLLGVPEERLEGTDKVRILVVDDEEDARLTLADVLEDLNYAVRSAANGQEALAIAAAEPFDIALLDVHLPDMLGTQLLRELKARHPDMACVMVTAYASVSTSVEALNEGASAYVMKPFEIPELAAVIREQAQKQRLTRENQRMMRVLDALQEISKVALATPNLQALPGKLLETFIQAIRGGGGAIVLVDDQGHPRVPLLHNTAQADDALRAMQSRASFLEPTPDAATRIALPLFVRNRCIGAVQVETPAGGHFTPRTRELAEALADRTALALENARLHEQERRSAREAKTLLQVAEALASTLHLNERLLIIAQTLADVAGCSRCMVFLRRNGSLSAACAHGITADESETFRAMATDVLRLDGSIRRAVEAPRPLQLTAPESEPDGSRTFLAMWRVRSTLIVPLVVGSEVIGAALVDTPDQKSQISPHDIRLCEAVASQAAVAIESARAFERERNIAEVLQKSFLPTVPSHLGPLSLAGRYYAALAEAQVGGDFFDIIEFKDGRVGLLMADVSGKGVGAAVHAAMGKYMLRAFAFEHREPSDALTWLNHALFDYSAQEVFITMFYGVIEPHTGEMRYVNAGHPPALIVRGADPHRGVRLGSTAPPVGAFRESTFAQDTVQIGSGDMLALYTDGVTEARSAGEFFGVERLEDVLTDFADEGPDSVADAVHRAVQQYAGTAAHDDIALIIAKAGVVE